MAQKKYTDGSGVSEIWLNIKNYVYSQLLGKADASHTHTKSQITDLDLSNYVDKTSNQTVAGQKIFTSLFSKSSNLERGTLPTDMIREDPIFISLDKNNRRTLAFYNYYYTNGNGRTVLYTYNQNSTDYDNIGLGFDFDNINSSKSIYPIITNTYNLGTSTNKWKSVYSNSYYLGTTAFGDIVTHNASEFVHANDLATVATSGSYNDLTDLPTIPSPYTPPTFTYDSSTETLTVSNTTATVFNYDSNTETLEIQVNG